MIKTTKIFLSLTILLIILTIGCGKEQKQESTAPVVDTIAVQSVGIVSGDITLTKVFAATLEGAEQANVFTKLSERITTLPVTVGIAVNKGQIIATLDKAGPTSQYYQAEAAFQNAAKDLERMRALLKEGAIAQQMFDGVQTQYNIAKANFEAAKSLVEITAPISGVISAINVKVGDNANPMMPMMTIAQVKSLKAIMNVGETDIADITRGQKVLIFSDVKPEQQLTASISEISRSADVQSRSFEVKALFANNASQWLHPGMFCKVKVSLQSKSNVLLVPVSSITMKNDKQVVYVITAGRAEERVIETGITDGEQSEILTGLKIGEQIITTGAANVSNGAYIRVQN